MRLLPAGDRALLMELGSLTEVLALFRQVALHPLDGVSEVVPAARTVLVRFDPSVVPASRVQAWLQSLGQQAEMSVRSSAQRPVATMPCVEIPVHYIGEDLDEVAQMLQVSRRELIERHVGTAYQAAFAGFAPGFVYLSGGDPLLQGVTRRAVPRTRVPASSVAIAGGFSAVYPSESPGGWRLLGVTPLKMWDLVRQPPALVQPGSCVRFRDLAARHAHVSLPVTPGAAVRDGVASVDPQPAPTPGMTSRESVNPAAWFEVLSPGAQTLVQDLGRPGMAALGVSASGALDRAASAKANRLVGNSASAAVLECAWGGLSLVCHGSAVVAVTGAPVSVVVATASGMRLPAAAGNQLQMRDGQVLRLGRPRAGMRCYVAVLGGWDVPPVLGSRATDVLASIGPAPLVRGDRLPVGELGGTALLHPARRPELSSGSLAPGEQAAGVRPEWAAPSPGSALVLRVLLGPRNAWFDSASVRRLEEQLWIVTPQSNRVGLRLSGEQPLVRAHVGELPSEGMVAGALQVPPSGQPVLFLADHPLTGGYPVVAVVLDEDLDLLAQASPGMQLRFKIV
ncbi:MAG TPA: 5-oxoprolinase/urea amidolyase family protein [Castellaniella sp.]|uniref:5-oxoprolinase subunit B/C family protein n=1 Tax=Castellaniella sp. TaxID=1955812 RepID=UPI002F20D7EC